MAALVEFGARADLGKGSNGAAFSHAGFPNYRVQGLHVVAEGGVLQQASRSNPAPIAHRGGSPEMALGLDHHIPAKAGALAERAAGGVDEAHPLSHPMAAQALLQHGFALTQLQPVVDAIDFIGIGHLHVHRRAEHGDGVGEIELPLVVVGGELGQYGGELGPVEAIDAGVGEVVAALLIGAVAVFHDPAHIALGVGKHAPVSAGIIEPGGEQGHRSAGAAVLVQESLQGFLAQQGHIPIEHQ